MSLARAMQRGPLKPFYPTAKRMALAALRAKSSMEAAAARAIALPLRGLPIGVQARLKYGFAPVARLDYPAHRILLHVDSAGALYRTAACRKEPETVRWIETHVKSGDVVYDVGANVGAYSLIASKHGRGTVRVVAFEPSFATYDELCRNILLNACDATISAHQICLTETPGVVEFRHSSVEPGSALHTTSETGAEPGGPVVYRQSLLGLSIDVLVAEYGFPIPNHLKIDVDGTEDAVLRGARRTLESREVRSLQVEVSPQDPSAAAVAAQLGAAGFRLVSDTARGGGTRWSNRLFVRS
jgi:FkbM family methyltransferase